MKIYIISIILSVSIFAAGFFVGDKYRSDDVPIITKKSEITSDIFRRDYAKLKLIEIEKELYKYDTMRALLDISPIQSSKLFTHRLSAKLSNREWYRDVKIKCQSSRNWTAYFSLIGAGVVAGGVIAYKLFKK